MKLFEFTKALIFAIPLGIFATLTALLCVIIAINIRRLEDNHKILFFFYFVCATLTSVLFIAYYYFPAFFKQADIVYGGTLVFTIILFHHLHCITMGSEERFSKWHYIIAAIVFSALLVFKLFLSGYLPSRNNDILFAIILVFSAYYTIAGFYEMHRFYVRQSITYGSTEMIMHRRAVLLILEKLMYPTVFGILPYIGGQSPGPFVSVLLMATILAALYNNIPLVYSIIRYFTLNDMNRSLFDAIQLRRQAVEITSERQGRQRRKPPETLSETPVKRVYHKYSHRHRATGQLIEVDKASFDSYFRKNKPYLNPNLTITDLIEPLHCNRTYLSKFVNRIYGMNFNNYINSCRLQEMDRLLALPGNRDKTPASLYARAGFGSYRNYLNAKNKL